MGRLYKLLISSLAGALLGCGLLVSAQARSASPVFMTVGAATSQPIGHYDFCQRYASECAVRTRHPSAVKLTQKIWNMILDVNLSVNARIEPTTDMELYGQEEYWEYPVWAGDCEDYVLQKRRELHALGLPLSSLLITVVRKPDGEGHAVLTIRTDHGDLVLDNLRGEVLNWSDTDYVYLKRQSEHHSGRWVAIEPPADLLVGSVRAK